MNKIINILLITLALLLSQCTDNVSGSAQQGEAKVTGIIQTDDGKPVIGSAIQLLPSDFNPIDDSIEWNRSVAYQTMTDDSGKFQIENVLSGNYVLNGQDTFLMKHIYIPEIIIENQDVNLGTKTLKNNSYVTIALNDSILTKYNYVYIEGTQYYTQIDSSNIITLPIPSDTIELSFFISDSGITEKLYDSIAVIDGDTIDLTGTPETPILLGKDSISIDSLYQIRLINFSDTLLYRFYWGNADTTQWIQDSVFYHNWDTTGTYTIKAQARTIGNILYSDWSLDFTVTVYANDSLNDTTYNDTINAPTTPTGNDTITQSISETYSTNMWGNDNNLYEFRFNWGDSTLSPWSSDTFATHTWYSDSTYQIKAMARLKTDTLRVSDWSPTLNIVVTF